VAIEHLTESILQDYLDGNLGNREIEIKNHLDNCTLCSARLEQYQQLYTELEVDTVPALSTDFSKAVMSQIAQFDPKSAEVETEKRRFASPALIYVIIGTITAIASIIYFVNLEPLLRAFRITTVSDYINRVIVDKVSLATADLGSVGDRFDFSLVLMVLATLIVIGGIDFIVRNYKHRTASFMV